MRRDIDRLMKEEGIDYLILLGEPSHSPNLAYLLKGAKLSFAILVKRRGEKPVLIYNPMERDEARKVEAELIPLSQFYPALRSEEKREGEEALLFEAIRSLKVKGRVYFAGKVAIEQYYPILNALGKEFPQIELVSGSSKNVIARARETKDEEEIERIREVGKKAEGIFSSVVELLKSLEVKEDILYSEDGKRMTVGRMKSFIRMRLAEEGLLEEIDTIFSVGGETAIPHNYGGEETVLCLGAPIVFDMFPRDRRSGYFFDITRTFFLGKIGKEEERIYSTVKEAMTLIMKEIRVGMSGAELYHLVCDFFEAKGYPTLRGDPAITSGFVHSLGHGVGLEVHEPPFLASAPRGDQEITPGMVFTIEPGLYFPEQGFGVRLEDVLYIDEKGVAKSLTSFPKEPLIRIGSI